MTDKIFRFGRKHSLHRITPRVMMRNELSSVSSMEPTGFLQQHRPRRRTRNRLERPVRVRSNSIQQSHRFFSETVMEDTSRDESIVSKSSDQLWKDMSPETRILAASIANEMPNIDSNNEAVARANEESASTGIHPRVAISRAITLMESKHPTKKKQGDLLLTYLLSLSPKEETTNSTQSFPTRSLRVGFAGPPGVGKSSMMEAFGMHLLEEDPDLKLAVVCIDPSSNISGGSILGDKTRMTRLSREVDRALVRPSCNSGVLGGLSAYTDDVVRLLGCAGYPLIFVETVGLGQSEIEVAESVDVLVLLVSPSGGDELQGVKKGIVEMANVLCITKNDGDLKAAAERTAADYKGALRVLHQGDSCHTDRWMPPVVKTSSINEEGLDNLWKGILSYQSHLLETGEWEHQRQKQAKYWMWKQFSRMIQVKIRGDLGLRAKANHLEEKLLEGSLTPRVAAQLLQDEMFESPKQEG